MTWTPAVLPKDSRPVSTPVEVLSTINDNKRIHAIKYGRVHAHVTAVKAVTSVRSPLGGLFVCLSVGPGPAFSASGSLVVLPLAPPAS